METKFVGDEVTEVTEAHVVPVGSFKQVLCGVECGYSKSVMTMGSESHVLEARKPLPWLMRMVSGRVEDRSL
jgi:hypothetical protein